MKANYLLVDEDTKEAERYASILSGEGLDVKPIPPKSDVSFLDRRLSRSPLAGIILDYKLTYGDPSIRYDAPTLAGHIRELTPNIPVVCLSAVLPTDQEARAAFKRMEGLFDGRFDKSDVARTAEPARNKLLSLADGYAQLRRSLKRRVKHRADVLGRLLGLKEDPFELAKWLATEGRFEPFLTAGLILHQLLEWPGPLLSPKHAAVQLGVDPAAYPRLEKAIRSALYSGPFSGVTEEPRYWLHELRNCKVPRSAPPAVCSASGGKAHVICDECGDPFDSFYTVGVRRVGAKPPFEKGRVCGICLKKDLEDFSVRPESRPLVENVIAETEAALKKRISDAKEAKRIQP